MQNLAHFRSGKPACYPDQSVYAAYACAAFGLDFEDLAGGTGNLIRVTARPDKATAKTAHFGAGRCSWYPQNNATASTLASDKYFTNRILEHAGIATLGGEYFFLHDRHQAHRPPGHERGDALQRFRAMGSAAFVKPLAGSRGDFAVALGDEAALVRYLDEVSRYYDSIIMQKVFAGREYRIFLVDDEPIYCARKYPPFLVGDGNSTIRELLAKHNEALRLRGLSPVWLTDDAPAGDIALPAGERWDLPGRMNRSAGGTMVFEAVRSEAALALARQAVATLGLRVAAVDLFTDLEADSAGNRIIEVNGNPAIGLLEQCGRGDLILKIWRHTFKVLGLLTTQDGTTPATGASGV
jgi:D-alanine-D-alanine ligase-like ATP-grasp enzyme